MKIQKLYVPAIRQFTLKRSRPMARSDQSIGCIQQRKDSSGIKMPTSACHAPFRQFGKRFAVKLGDFERSLIDTSLTYDELKSAFHMMDKNNDGCVDVRELARLFVYDPRACEKFVKKIIDTVDIDNSGNLSFSEFLMLMVKTEGVEGVRAAFQSYDADNSGTITIQELAGWMKRHGKSMSEDELEKMISAFDVDGNGEIDYDEFLLLVCRRILREKAHEVKIDITQPPREPKFWERSS